MPDMNTLMEPYGLDEDWFNAYEIVYFTADVVTNEHTLKCSWVNGCRVRARWLYTPIWYGMSPPVLYPGQKATLIVDPAGAPWRQFGGTFIHMIDIKLDDIELNMSPFMDEEEQQETLGARTINYVEGMVATKTRTRDSHVTAWFHGAGYAYKQELAAKNCNFDGTDCYDVRIMPSITAISTDGGYTTGGQEITITGTSLNATLDTIDI